jgi:serine/threonine protein kinase/ribosomal protein S27E
MTADEDTVRRDRLDEVLADYMQRVDAGHAVDRAGLLAEHPDLAADLSAFFAAGDKFNKAAHPDVTVAFTPTKSRSTSTSNSRGLQIRCPHCCNPVEVLVDTPYEEISCTACGSSFSLVQREEQTKAAAVLKSIGRFELISRLGVGGFGSVWKARDVELDRVVAVKIPRRSQLSSEEIHQFFREARAAAQLRHPNIVTVHEVGRDGETIFIVCDLVRGVELSDWLSVKRPHSREAAELCKTISLALHHAHEQSVIHRDLKPSNIMIDVEGEPHIMDFGLAKREIGEITMTMDGQVLGTPAYMSPEQAAGHGHWTDRRTDIYSLGVILFRMLTSELPFRGNAQMQVHQRLTEDAPDPRSLNRHAPRDLATICMKCLERDPNRRYPNAKAVAEEFDRFLRGMPIQARPLSRMERLGRWAKRKPALATIAALVLLLSVAGPLTALQIDRQRRRLAGLVEEKNDLIDRYADEKQQDAASLAQANREIELWNGKTNPWKLWPPRAAEPPRQKLIQELYQRRYDGLSAALQNKALGEWELACGRLALATLAAETGHHADAERQLITARDALLRLTQQHPAEASYGEALADCYGRLATLTSERDPAKSREYLHQSSDTLKGLAEGKDGAKYQIGRLEAEMRGAVDAGFDAAAGHLIEATRLNKDLAAVWPTDPVALYEIVCRLTRQEPVLLPRSPQKAGQAGVSAGGGAN